MQSARSQRTIGDVAVVTGYGYWSGLDVRVEFRPAAPNTGIVFVRRDLDGCPVIRADIQHRVEGPRRTSLSVGPASVEMIEHVMAALAGLAIDNCQVWVDEAEMPGCDGSSLPFVEALDGAGIVLQDAPRPRQVVSEPLRLGNSESWIEARPSASGQTVLECRLDYGAGPIGRQSHRLVLTPETFRRDLAPCRTFLLKHEADWLLAQGLGTRVAPGDLLVFDDRGPIENSLRLPDECVRHKVLDMVGDLALAGVTLVGEFVAYRSGHRLNAELVRALVSARGIACGIRRCA